MKAIFSVALTAIALIGCTTNTGIVQINDDTYMYGKQEFWAYSGSGVKADMYKEARIFCESKGKKLVPMGSTGTDYVPYATYAGAEIQFMCK